MSEEPNFHDYLEKLFKDKAIDLAIKMDKIAVNPEKKTTLPEFEAEFGKIKTNAEYEISYQNLKNAEEFAKEIDISPHLKSLKKPKGHLFDMQTSNYDYMKKQFDKKYYSDGEPTKEYALNSPNSNSNATVRIKMPDGSFEDFFTQTDNDILLQRLRYNDTTVLLDALQDNGVNGGEIMVVLTQEHLCQFVGQVVHQVENRQKTRDSSPKPQINRFSAVADQLNEKP